MSQNSQTIPRAAPHRPPILPREEEGQEPLPPYTCTLHRTSLLRLKPELSTPFTAAPCRAWRHVCAVLHGTVLRLHRPASLFSGKEVGKLVSCYTMQLADVGVAADYKKREFTIRVRVQTEQFLLSCGDAETFIDWLEALNAAVELAHELDERGRAYRTLPRRRRRRRAAVDAPPAAAARPAAATTATEEPVADTRDDRRGDDGDSGSGKWAPSPTRVSPEANMRYARRCMAVLSRDAPRKTQFVVKDGKRYRIVWEKQEMVLDTGEPSGGGGGGEPSTCPPSYEEAVGGQVE